MSFLDKILKRNDNNNELSSLDKALAAFNGRIKYIDGQPYAEHLLELTQIPDTDSQYSIRISYTNKKIEARRMAPRDKDIEHNQAKTDQFISSVETFLEQAGINANKQDFKDQNHTGVEITFSADTMQLRKLTNKVSDAYADLDKDEEGQNYYYSRTALPTGNQFDHKYIEAARDAAVKLAGVLAGEETDIQASVAGTQRRSEPTDRIITLTLHDPDAVVEAGLREALGRDGISVKKNGDTSVITIHASHPDNKGFGGIMRHATLALQERGIDIEMQQRKR
ncbi:MAG TPA: hypothetical protein VFT64_02455 [Rickettsiales bacterium]|nr:hypothetical protein [Rickettsiales bacterium]